MPNPVRWSRAHRANWGTAPPLLAAPFWPRLRIVSQDPEPLRIISHYVAMVKSHFIDGRTCGCTEQEGLPCFIDHVEHGAGRWEGWLAVYSLKWRKNYLLCLTKVVAHQNPTLVLPGLDLRGRRLDVSRKYSGMRAPMRARLCDDLVDESGLDPAPDLVVLIERLWLAEDRKDVRNRRPRGIEAHVNNAVANGVHCG